MEWLLGYLAIGAVVGFFAGLLGIGGGAIMVPLLVALFAAQGLPKATILHLAVGTSMATILFTSVSSVRAHALRGALRWDIARKITPGILFGAVAGALAAGGFSTFGFAVFFAAFVFSAATSMLLDRRPKPSRELPGTLGMFIAGSVISALSALAAIGGAVMTVPFLLYCNVPMLQAIGTAAAIGFPIALGGSIGFVATGLNAAQLPPYSFGYIYLPALAGITVASMLFAPLGAALAHRLPTKRLKQIFAVLLYVFAARMLIALW
jgi:uncharacterized membrane protein YfcA